MSYSAPPPPPQYTGPQTTSSNAKAVTALVLGLFSIFCFGILTGLPAAIFGYLGLQEANKPGGSGKGMAIAGMVLGGLSTISTFIIIGLIAGSGQG